ncbi:hypothetical protein MUK70_12740 [Dyadobacter chenwenxiniae]|uniref:Uncharacterized protein n=1 Tax=Dyadobacter chenwenxiniae TaxID=2906456 RepID=A0A9X1PH35_9BACT|nr:hypothetical protein [Dyadobacter chenwenxiniae]MCF0060110.1 hypothetical protein [Dyadobacter chenwenxiniae]UON85848.1 hypothetical protein MUK70_12740 [Dyadobacter chenwenxiniae]
MKIEQINAKVQSYLAAKDLIKKKQETWQNKIRDLIFDLLKNLSLNSDLPARAELNDAVENHNSVILVLNDEVTNFRDHFTGKRFIKKGGSLIFAQLKNGNIMTVIKKPELPELGSDYENLIIGKEYPPESLNSNVVLDIVGDFIDKMIEWENSQDRGQIGF